MKLDEFTHTNSADISFLLFLSLGFIHIYVCLYGSYEKWGKMTMIMAIEEAQDIRALQKKNRRMGKKLENPLMSSPCIRSAGAAIWEIIGLKNLVMLSLKHVLTFKIPTQQH